MRKNLIIVFVFLSAIFLGATLSVHAGSSGESLEFLVKRVAELKKEIDRATRLRFGSAGVTVPNAPINGIVQNGTTGSVLFVGTNQQLTQNNANFFWDNTNTRLGVGTTSPWGVLSVNAPQAIPPFVIGSSTPGYTNFLVDQFSNVGISTSSPQSRLGIQALSLSSVPLLLISTSTASATSTAVVIDSKGKIGVGTTSPTKTLSVVGNIMAAEAGTTTLTLSANGTNQGSCIELRGASSSVMYRMYIGDRGGDQLKVPLIIEVGSCASQAVGQ